MYHVWNLQMPLSQKTGVAIMFLLGGFTVITRILRIYMFTQALATVENPLFRHATRGYMSVYFWTLIECNVGVLSACLPTLRPIYRHYKPSSVVSRLKGSMTYSRPTSRSGADVEIVRAKNTFFDIVSIDTHEPIDTPVDPRQSTTVSLQKPAASHVRSNV